MSSGIGALGVEAAWPEEGASLSPLEQREVLLGQLAFANPLEMPAIVDNNIESLDDSFYRFLESRISAAQSADEREALILLRDCITDLMTQMISSALKTESINEDELRLASLLPSTFMSEASIQRCDALIDDLTWKRTRRERDAYVEAAFEKMDARFFERLADRLASADAEEKKKLATLNQNIEHLMSVRLSAASQALQNVLRVGDSEAMERQIKVLNAKGGLDDNVLLLLDANIEQARRAGAQEASEVLVELRDTGLELLSRSEEWEVRVTRILLRTQNSKARSLILEEEFRAPINIGEDAWGAIRGKKLAQHLRDLLSQYKADTGFRDKVSAIGEEAETVACDVFDFDDPTKAFLQVVQSEKFHSRTVPADWIYDQAEGGSD